MRELQKMTKQEAAKAILKKFKTASDSVDTSRATAGGGLYTPKEMYEALKKKFGKKD